MQPNGFKFSAVEATINKPGRLDFALIFSEVPAIVAAVFTTNKVKAAPVLLCMERVKSGICQALVVNSGNANACTGPEGMNAVSETAKLASQGLGIAEEFVFVASTGVIGQQMPMNRVRQAMPELVKGLSGSTLADVARAIMTTDTLPKMETRTGTVGGRPYTLAGIAKGAGMIMPNMATMLAFIVTDVALDPGWLQKIFRESTDSSFNMISVDGDTSTNDMAVIMANGKADNTPLEEGSPDAAHFVQLLRELLLELARQIVRDGEGATKFVTITVRGAISNTEARRIAMSVANSVLVKTAFFGQDANWGRILAAVGYAGAMVDQERVELSFDDVLMVKNGVFTGGDAEARGTKVLKRQEFTLNIDLCLGEGLATVFTSDLSYDYVKINADYRT